MAGITVADSQRATFWQTISIVLAGLLYIGVSATLINFNKYLIKPNRFPYSSALVLLHTMMGSCLSGGLFLIKPSLFPSITDSAAKVSIDRRLILRGAAPIAIFFAIQLVLTNTAYLHSSVAFLQMMKEANVVLVYGFSLIAALETFSGRHAQVLVCVLLATTLTIQGELHFSLAGFLIQASGQIFESLRIVLQGVLLTGKKLDPMTYQLLISPLCFLFLASFMGCASFAGPSMSKLGLPPMSLVIAWWPILLANGLVAFALNVSIALFMKMSSPVSFVLAGIVKDCAIVSVSALFMHEDISGQQIIGFSLQLCAILLWSLMKRFPEEFENGMAAGLLSVLLGSGSSESKIEKANGCYGSTGKNTDKHTDAPECCKC